MTAPIKDANFYADFGSLSALKRDARADSQKTLRAAAQQFESLFTDMMLKSMRDASIGDSMTGSDTVDMYQGMFDQQLAMQMSKGRGLGLADMLVQQLTRTGLVPGGPQAGSNTSAPPAANTVVPLKTGATQTNSAAGVGAATAATHAADAIDQVSEAASGNSQTRVTSNDTAELDWPPATPEEFVQRLLPHAQAAAQQLGVDAATLVAHAALETGWGKHMPSNADGSSSFNMFGIKATTGWHGQSVGATTLEYEQGIAVKRVERFKSYDSPADCFGDYAKLLAGAERYTSARNSGGNANQFAQALQQGGYATDPDYANKLRAVAGAVRAIEVNATQVTSTQAGSTQAITTQVNSNGTYLSDPYQEASLPPFDGGRTGWGQRSRLLPVFETPERLHPNPPLQAGEGADEASVSAIQVASTQADT
jgi:peptidoglycan hydrolase FlgJ